MGNPIPEKSDSNYPSDSLPLIRTPTLINPLRSLRNGIVSLRQRLVQTHRFSFDVRECTVIHFNTIA